MAPERLREELGAGAAAVAPVLPAVRTVLPDVPPAAPLDREDGRFRFFDAVTQWLLAMAHERPVVVLLDDLHWADPDSLRLLRHVARAIEGGVSRLLIVGLYRPPEQETGGSSTLAPALAMLLREAGYRRIALSGLSVEELTDYLKAAAGRPLPPALARAIHAETDGNPFYAREVFRHLNETGVFARLADGWRADIDPADLGVPEGVRQVVERRLGRLSPETNRLLRAAAAFAGGFTFPTLEAVTGMPEESLLDSLDEALTAGLIRRGDDGYDFAHAIVRYALYDGLNPDRRARLHGRIAEALERRYAGREAAHAAELAAQYFASASLPGSKRGIAHCLAAARQRARGTRPSAR